MEDRTGMLKPLIGITTTNILKSSKTPKYGANELYAEAISNSGGLPVLIPLNLSQDDLDTLLCRLDGILFSGGGDIHPRKYGGELHPQVKGVEQSRDEVEIHLIQSVIETGKPFLGICRGLQVINVAMGGSLYEHLQDQLSGGVTHDNHTLPRDFLAHSVSIEANSQLSQILSTSQARVNSLHHQGVRKLADGLLPTAYAPDELIEAFELPGHSFGLAVQWHPEELLEHEAMRKLFQAFIHACLADPRKI
jgi:putative glutamine amidotransferase